MCKSRSDKDKWPSTLSFCRLLIWNAIVFVRKHFFLDVNLSTKKQENRDGTNYE